MMSVTMLHFSSYFYFTGIDCYGNEREILTEQARFYNNKLLSDVVLQVENEKFFAHKLVLVRASQVFERMFTSRQWDSHKEKVIFDHRCCNECLLADNTVIKIYKYR